MKPDLALALTCCKLSRNVYLDDLGRSIGDLQLESNRIEQSMSIRPMFRLGLKLKGPSLTIGSPLIVASITETPSERIIAFRGSLMPSRDNLKSISKLPHVARDWWYANLRFGLTRAWYCDGLVSIGFRNVLASMMGELKQYFNNDAGPLRFTGHSLGGALAILAAHRCARENLDVSGVMTYGAPKVGDRVFANSAKFPIERFENQGDPVPALPTRFANDLWIIWRFVSKTERGLRGLWRLMHGRYRPMFPRHRSSGRGWSLRPDNTIAKIQPRPGGRGKRNLIISEHDISLYVERISNAKVV